MAGIYIHFPFCKKKCQYCDFYSIEKTEQLIPQFLNAFQKEIGLRKELFFSSEEHIKTVYFGGGTPSILRPVQIETLLCSINSSFCLVDDSEITIEANPGTLSPKVLRNFRKIGINRISIGVQSFDTKELKILGRIHTPDEANKTVMYAIKAGFDRIGIDLIYGLPGQSKLTWQRNLRKAVSLDPTHISTYALTWNKSTLLGREIENGNLPYPDEEIVTEMAIWTDDFLSSKGYEHYEISNFAKPGYRCLHNQGYWTGENYLGLGPSAHSFIKNRRFWNISDVVKYIDVLSGNRIPVGCEEMLSPEQQSLERITLGLRMREGVQIEELNEKKDQIISLVQAGLAENREGYLSLTPKGFLLADEVALQLTF